nr:Rha family transcriptional regulator [uncultured Undibacterium sp.]
MKAKIKKAAVRGATSLKTRPNFNTSIVHVFKGELVTDSLAIAQEFGRRHDNVMQSLDDLVKDGTINRLDFKVVKYLDAKGEQRRKIELSERGALIAMPFIGGKKSRQGQVILVNSFMAMRAEAAGQAPWIESRKAAAVSYITMSETLQETREDQGKVTAGYHYCNEAKMINGILFDTVGAVDRKTLSSNQLSMLVRVESKNAILIGMGKEYSERKAALIQYVAKLIAKASPKLGGLA